MKRTKEWWAQFTKEERSELVRLEKADALDLNVHLLPGERSKCGGCSALHLGQDLCPRCFARLMALIDKADAGVTASTNPKN